MQLGFHTILVLSGGTKREDLDRYAYRPKLIVDSLGEVLQRMEQREWSAPWDPVEPMPEEAHADRDGAAILPTRHWAHMP